MNNHSHSKNTLKRMSIVGMMVIGAMVLSACMGAAAAANTPAVSPGQPTETTAPATTTQAAPTSQPTGTALSLDVSNNPAMGRPILVDNRGFTLYMKNNDTANTSTCDAACQKLWPPLESSSLPAAGTGVDAALIGTGTLPTGGTVITYNQHPLYYKATDTQPGDITGEGALNIWFVVTPSGNPAMLPSTPTPATTPLSTPTAAAPVTISNPMLEAENNPTLAQNIITIGGITLYAYTQDTANTSNCNTACQQVWAPVHVLGTPVAGTGVSASLLGTAKQADGSVLLTYNQMPVYFFKGDTKAGTINGQGFDNVWFAINSDGNSVGSVTEVTINVASNPTLGNYLVNGNGIAMYAFGKNTANTDNCSGVCPTIWPPVLTLGSPNLGQGVDPSLVGEIPLSNGMQMVTYNGMPLYYYSGDGSASQVLGQGYLNLWYVVSPAGQPITTPLSTP